MLFSYANGSKPGALVHNVAWPSRYRSNQGILVTPFKPGTTVYQGIYIYIWEARRECPQVLLQRYPGFDPEPSYYMRIGSRWHRPQVRWFIWTPICSGHLGVRAIYSETTVYEDWTTSKCGRLLPPLPPLRPYGPYSPALEGGVTRPTPRSDPSIPKRTVLQLWSIHRHAWVLVTLP